MVPVSRPAARWRANRFSSFGVVLEMRADLAADDLVVLVAPRRRSRRECRRRARRASTPPPSRRRRAGAASARPALPRRMECRSGCCRSRSWRRRTPSARSTRRRRCRSRRATASSRLRPRASGRRRLRLPLPPTCTAHRPLPTESAVGGTRLAARRVPDVEHHGAVRPVDRTRGDGFVDDVDQPADGVRAVEQRRRPAHDLDARGARRIHRHAVIAGLAGQIADPLAVLEDQHAIAVQAANHRPRGSRAERPLRNAGLRLQRRAERGSRARGSDRLPASTEVG